MKTILRFLIIIPLLFSCKSKEEKFLEKHQVFFCETEEFESFVKKAKIKPQQAWDLMSKYVETKKIDKPHLLFFSVDGNYVFTRYFHPKIPNAYTGGIWVNSNTGKIQEVEKGIFIEAFYQYKWD